MRGLIYIYSLKTGGAQSFIYNTLSKFDENFTFDFVLQDTDITYVSLHKLIKKRGYKIFSTAMYAQHPKLAINELENIVKKNKYDFVHYHANSLINITPFIVCQKNDIPLIVHSHNSLNNKGFLFGRVIHCLNRKIFLNEKIIKIACSNKAGKWMFGNKNFNVVYNGIDLEKFCFKEEWRCKLRNKWAHDFEYVIGDMSRFVPAKNHLFLIEIFASLLRIRKDCCLILVGGGSEEDKIKKSVDEHGLNEYVKFAGRTDFPEQFYSAFDLFLRPSLFEGLPFSLVEAQISGLKIVASDVISKEVDINNEICFMNLNDSSDDWAKLIDKILSSDYKSDNRLESYKKFIGSKFDSEISVNQLKTIYSSLKDKGL